MHTGRTISPNDAENSREKMNWKREEEEKPPFSVPVLAWIECPGCKNNRPHAHSLMSKPFPKNGPFIGIYHPADPELVKYRRKLGDHSFDDCLKPRWSPTTPTYWCDIEEP